MKGSLGDKVRLQHILDTIQEVKNYLKDTSYDEFLKNSEKRFATLKQIKIVGEASNALTAELRSSYPLIPWKPIIGIRNISIHEYFGVNMLLVWEIVQTDLPELKKNILQILLTLSE